MNAITLLHFVLRWLLVLFEAGAWLWLAAMLVALAGWGLWAVHHGVARIRRSIGSSGRLRGATASHIPVPILRLPTSG